MGATIFFVGLFVIVNVHVACDAADLTQILTTSDGFTIRLQDYWTAIPKDVLYAYSKALTKMVPGADKQTYAYGFQLSTAQNWFAYPYILIQTKKGRIPEAQLESIKKLQRELDGDLTRTQDFMAAIVSDARLGEAIYDPSSHIVFTQMEIDVNEVGLVKAFIAIVLTEEGVIQINGYVKAPEFPDYAPVFEQIARSIVIDDHMKYQPEITDSNHLTNGINWGNVLLKATGGAIVGGLLAVIVVLYKKKRNPNK